MFCSCTAYQSEKYLHSDLLEEIHRLTVPFIPQTQAGYCGVVALTMILNYWNDPVEQNELIERVYLPSLKGTLSVDLVEYAKTRGFNAELYFGNLQDIKDKIRLGYPLIAILSNKTNSVGHYIVLVGYNDKNQSVLVHKEKSPYEEISYEKFLALWKNTDNLTVFISPQW